VLEKAFADFQRIIRELGKKKRLRVGKELLLSWERNCHFLAKDYTIWLWQEEI
jgi:hypothetical protein